MVAIIIFSSFRLSINFEYTQKKEVLATLTTWHHASSGGIFNIHVTVSSHQKASTIHGGEQQHSGVSCGSYPTLHITTYWPHLLARRPARGDMDISRSYHVTVFIVYQTAEARWFVVSILYYSEEGEHVCRESVQGCNVSLWKFYQHFNNNTNFHRYVGIMKFFWRTIISEILFYYHSKPVEEVSSSHWENCNERNYTFT